MSLLPTQLQELLGPDLTYLINLGYGDGSRGLLRDTDSPADVDTPFGLFPDVSGSQVFSTLVADTQQGIQNLMSGTDPYASATSTLDPASTGQSVADIMAAMQTDPPPTPRRRSPNSSTRSRPRRRRRTPRLLPSADIVNALVTSMPAYDLSLFTANLANGDYIDAFGLPFAADTALVTLAAGFEVEVMQNAASHR